MNGKGVRKSVHTLEAKGSLTRQPRGPATRRRRPAPLGSLSRGSGRGRGSEAPPLPPRLSLGRFPWRQIPASMGRRDFRAGEPIPASPETSREERVKDARRPRLPVIPVWWTRKGSRAEVHPPVATCPEQWKTSVGTWTAACKRFGSGRSYGGSSSPSRSAAREGSRMRVRGRPRPSHPLCPLPRP